MNNKKETAVINWVQLVVNVITSVGICLGGLGVLVNLKLQPMNDDIKENKEVAKSIHEMSKNLAVLTANYEHIKEIINKKERK